MKANTEPLYHKLLKFPLNETDVSYPFEKRLQIENSWSRDHTRRVLLEYRRFLFLAAITGHSVSPPDAIDQAWHLHLIYTRSYWDDLCRDTLGFPLHHGPTKGGAEETGKFTDMYARTIQSYSEWFGEPPPMDIWLPPTERFARARNHYRRINTADYWMIPKTLATVALLLPGLFLLALFLTGAQRTSDVSLLSGIAFLVLLLILMLLVVLKDQRKSQRRSRGYWVGSSSGTDGSWAFLAGGDDNPSHGHGHGHSDSGHHSDTGGHSDGGSHGDGGGHGCGSDGGSSGCGSSGCGSSGCGGGGCGS